MSKLQMNRAATKSNSNCTITEGSSLAKFNVWTRPHSDVREHDNAGLFLGLGLPSTLILNELLESAIQTGGIWNCRLFFLVWTENILRNEYFKNDGITVTIVRWFPWLSFSQLKSKITGEHLMLSQSEIKRHLKSFWWDNPTFCKSSLLRGK